jgi:hypothetical protein
MNFNILCASELTPDGNCDVTRIQTRRCDLIEKRLEKMVIPLIDKDDKHILLVDQLLCRTQAAEAASDYDNDFPAGCSWVSQLVSLAFFC